MSRTLNVVRMQFVNRQTFIWIPLLVLSGALILSLAIYAMIPSLAAKIGGGSMAPLWYFLVTGVYGLTLTFPFSQAMSVTRREYYLGTLLTAVITSLGLALIFMIGGLVEQATGGWWMNGWFFYLDWIWAAGPFTALFVYFVIAMLFFITGFWAATIYKRFGALWLTVVLVAIGLALIGVLWIIGSANAWVPFFTAITEAGALGLALWGVLLGVVLAGISFVLLRRATP